MNILATLNLENVLPSEAQGYTRRNAARVVLLDQHNRVALTKVGTEYYKLPGGWVEEGESFAEAALRECREETGYEVTLLAELGMVQEIRNVDRLQQDSVAFLARVTGGDGILRFTQEEIERGFSLVWCENLEAAIAMLTTDKPRSLFGEYIQQRDAVILRAAKKTLSND